jgi:hypothetical protein
MDAFLLDLEPLSPSPDRIPTHCGTHGTCFSYSGLAIYVTYFVPLWLETVGKSLVIESPVWSGYSAPGPPNWTLTVRLYSGTLNNRTGRQLTE